MKKSMYNPIYVVALTVMATIAFLLCVALFTSCSSPRDTTKDEMLKAQYNYMKATEAYLDSIYANKDIQNTLLDVIDEKDVYIDYIEAKAKVDSLLNENL